MGAHPYWYFVPYQVDVQAALEALRKREFAAGRYNPVIPFPNFPPGPDASGPGAQHESIDEALEDSAEDGTRSILDLQSVGDEADFLVAARLSDEQLEELYGTAKPTRAMVENLEFLEAVERGQGVYAIVYKNDRPDEILFAGYSFD